MEFDYVIYINALWSVLKLTSGKEKKCHINISEKSLAYFTLKAILF